MTAPLRRLPPDIRSELHGRRQALLDQTAPLGPRMRRRLRFYVVGATIGMPIVLLLLAPVSGLGLVLLLPLAALYGALVAWFRPGAFQSAILTWACYVAILVASGSPIVPTGFHLFRHAFVLFLGAAIGTAEEARAGDGL